MTTTDIFAKAGVENYFDESYGWAIFKNVGKAGWGIGGAAGKGEVYAKVDGPDESAKLVGTTSLAHLSFGFQFGGQVFAEVIFFQTKHDFDHFTSGNFEFSADANVVAITAGANAKASTLGLSTGASARAKNARVNGSGYNNGMAAFTIVKGGLMYEASIGGQKFGYKPLTSPLQ